MPKVKILKKANNGIQIEDNNFTPLSSSTIMLNGSSHKKGGTMISYGDSVVEAEAGEPVFLNKKKELIIAGNLVNPLTGNKFKSDAKTLGKKEAKNDKLFDYSLALMNNSNPYDKWDSLKFNSGRVMTAGTAQKKAELSQSKEQLGAIQQAILERADELGVDADAFAKGTLRKTNGGKTAQNGAKLSLAERNNNPGNLKFSKWMEKYGAVKGQAGTDGGNFAVFPSVKEGQRAMVELLNKPLYKNKTVGEAIKTWTGGSPYKNIPEDIKNMKVGTLAPNQFGTLLNTITQGEDSKLYNWEGVGPTGSPSRGSLINGPIDRKTMEEVVITGRNPYRVPVPNIPDQPWSNGIKNPYLNNAPSPVASTPQNTTDFTINPPQNYNVGTDAEPFNYTQIIPELYAAATNRIEPVVAQRFTPELQQPFNVSFQDRRNLANSNFRAISQRLQGNPNALATLAAQKYEADNQINAEEFRINQGIQNDVINKNTQLLNDAQVKNLQIADTQYVRQAQAKSNTKAVNQNVLNSISDKLAKHSLENRTLQTYENLYPNFRFGDNYQAQHVGARGEEFINFGGASSNDNPFTSKSQYKDKMGNVTKTVENTPSPVRQRLEEDKLIQSRNKTFQQMINEGSFNYNPKTNKTSYSSLKGYDYSKF